MFLLFGGVGGSGLWDVSSLDFDGLNCMLDAEPWVSGTGRLDGI